MLQLDATRAEVPVPGEMLIEEERRLYERVVQRDASALLECLDRIGHLVYCMALRHTGRQDSAEQLTEAVFLAFWRDPEVFPPSEGPLGRQFVQRMIDGPVRLPGSHGQELPSAGGGGSRGGRSG